MDWFVPFLLSNCWMEKSYWPYKIRAKGLRMNGMVSKLKLGDQLKNFRTI